MTERRRPSPDLPPAEDPTTERLAELESRLAKLEHEPSLRARGRSLMSRVVPDEATTHFRAAGRHQLLGFRAIIDHWINRIDASEGTDRPTREEIRIE